MLNRYFQKIICIGMVVITMFPIKNYGQGLMDQFRSVSLFSLQIQQKTSEIETQVQKLVEWKRRDFALSEAEHQKQNGKLLASDCEMAVVRLEALMEELAFCPEAVEKITEARDAYALAALHMKFSVSEWARVCDCRNKKEYQMYGNSARKLFREGKQKAGLGHHLFNSGVEIVKDFCIEKM